MALATVKLWLQSNHSSIDRVIFCSNENADYEIYKELMPTVYFPLSKHHLTNINMKEAQILTVLWIIKLLKLVMN